MDPLWQGLLERLPCVAAIIFVIWMGNRRDKEKDEISRQDRDRTAQAFKDQDEMWRGLLVEAYKGRDRRENGGNGR